MSTDDDADRTRGVWRVFLSHTSELASYPDGESFLYAAIKAINAAGHLAVEMDFWPAVDRPPREEVERQVRSCSVYVGLLGHRYGETVPDEPELSYTELEFEIARRAGLPRLIFLLDDDALLPLRMHDPTTWHRQRAFRARAGNGRVRKTFQGCEELRHQLGAALRQLTDEGLPPRRTPVEPAPPRPWTPHPHDPGFAQWRPVPTSPAEPPPPTATHHPAPPGPADREAQPAAEAAPESAHPRPPVPPRPVERENPPAQPGDPDPSRLPAPRPAATADATPVAAGPAPPTRPPAEATPSRPPSEADGGPAGRVPPAGERGEEEARPRELAAAGPGAPRAAGRRERGLGAPPARRDPPQVAPAQSPPGRPWWERARGRRAALWGGLAAAALAAAVVVWAPWKDDSSGARPTPEPTAVAQCKASTGDVDWAPDGQCVGYIVQGKPFGTDPRLVADQKAIFAENQCAQVRAGGGPPPRKEVYLGALTSKGDNAAPSEALEGLLMQQFRHNGVLRPDGGCEAPTQAGLFPLEIVLANAGDQMARIQDLSGSLLGFVRGDESVLGVIGLERSTLGTKQFAGVLDQAGVPVLATTLTADSVSEGKRYYRQLAASNQAQAQLIAKAVPKLGRGATSTVLVATPSDADFDPYLQSLRNDLLSVLKQRGLKAVSLAWPTQGAGTFPKDQAKFKDAVCPPSGQQIDVIVYVGRAEPFPDYAGAVSKQKCGGIDQAPIIADDGISRYVSLLETREASAAGAPDPLWYVTLSPRLLAAGGDCVEGQPIQTPGTAGAALSQFCTQVDIVYSYLRGQNIFGRAALTEVVPWPGDALGTSYDAVQLLDALAGDLSAPQRGQITQRMPGLRTFDGAIGTYHFNASWISTNELGITRISHIGAADERRCIATYSFDGKYIDLNRACLN